MTDQANTTQTPPQSSSQANPSSSGDQGSSGGSQTTQTTQAASRPDWLPEAHWDAGTNAIKPEFATHFKELSDVHAAHTARLAARPEKADGYELKFADGFTPEVPIKFEPDDPRVAPLREFAHKHNWSQAEFSEALQIEAALVAAETNAYKAAVAEQTKKLGAKATERVTAIKTWLTGHLGAEAAEDLLGNSKPGDPKQFGLINFSADAIGYLEKLQLAFSSQGNAPINGNGREPQAPPPTTMEDRWYGKGKAS